MLWIDHDLVPPQNYVLLQHNGKHDHEESYHSYNMCSATNLKLYYGAKELRIMLIQRDLYLEPRYHSSNLYYHTIQQEYLISIRWIPNVRTSLYTLTTKSSLSIVYSILLHKFYHRLTNIFYLLFCYYLAYSQEKCILSHIFSIRKLLMNSIIISIVFFIHKFFISFMI